MALKTPTLARSSRDQAGGGLERWGVAAADVGRGDTERDTH